MRERIYLDSNATTMVDPIVAEAVSRSLLESHGNPSSVHFFGQEAKRCLQEVRRGLASYLGVRPTELIFTSGGTEGLNLLIRGLLPAESKGHIITSDLEHSAVYNTVKGLESQGFEASFLSPGSWGAVRDEELRAALRPDTRLIVLMAANNETGVKMDIPAIAALAGEAGVPLVIDGVALMGKESFSIPAGVTAMAFSGHKFHAPTGVGMVYLRRGQKLTPCFAGGGHEYGMRPGTENLSGIVGLGEAVKLLSHDLLEASERMGQLRDYLEQRLQEELKDVYINGEGPRVANTSNVSFLGVDGEALLMNLDMEGVAVSHGSACAAGALEPSRVLLNMGLSHERAATAIRFSLCRFTTKDEIDRAISIVVQVVSRLRAIRSSTGR